MSELERDLFAIGELLDVPAAPALATRVGARLRPRRRRLVVVVATLCGLAVASLNTPVVADWMRAGGVEIRREAPPVTAVPNPLSLGVPARLDAESLVPAALGRPDEVWRSGSVLWLAYRPSPSLPAVGTTGYGALVSQARRSIPDDLLATKFVEPSTVVERVDLGTGRAFWIEGVHYFALLRPDGDIEVDQLRLANKVLLWERGDVVLRFESALGRDDAIRVAQSVG